MALPTRWRLLIPTAAPVGLLPRSSHCLIGVTGAAGPIAAAAALVACGELAVACEELAAARGGLALAQPAGSISAPARRRVSVEDVEDSRSFSRGGKPAGGHGRAALVEAAFSRGDVLRVTTLRSARRHAHSKPFRGNKRLCFRLSGPSWFHTKQSPPLLLSGICLRDYSCGAHEPPSAATGTAGSPGTASSLPSPSPPSPLPLPSLGTASPPPPPSPPSPLPLPSLPLLLLRPCRPASFVARP